MGVYLANCDAQDFAETVASAVDLSEYSDPPDALTDANSVRLWGAAEGSSNEDHYETLEPGDLVLFHQDGSTWG